MLQRVGLAAAAGTALLLAACASQGIPATEAAPATTAPATTAAAKPVASPTSPKVTLPDRYDPKRNPATDLKAALALAKADGKAVLIDFGADWCPDCHVLHELFEAPETKPLIEENYHLLAVDVGEFDHNLQFTAKYIDLSRSGIPALVVVTPAGKIRVATNDGSFANARSMDSKQVNAFLTKWAPKR
ncbi:thioredoxin family protein [Micromonospora eburnea]|uniref:Thioredoxin-like n=1 Tax=Micromonospora eburnea TaxID=227316 RepID=A0A1C6TS47_9ACTN|nr:thioredoxin family protein [Micromonospora eburnea]SCL44451.1 Thioredoxin-like [Micromonospora eburnea]